MLCLFLLFGTGSVCLASHIFGGELLYTHLSGKLYKITLTLYGDCGADAVTFDQLYVATPRISIYNGGVFKDTISLKLLTGSGNEVSAVCPSQLGNTKCNGGSLPGVRQFIYEDTVSLIGASSIWLFRFDGTLGNGIGPVGSTAYSAGRSSQITNATPGTYMQIDAELNTLHGHNSSPQYSTIPTPYYCINVLQQYNHGAVDADGDSLSYSMVPAIDAHTGVAVNYVSPFTAYNPLAVASGNFNFSPLNGQMTFNPNAIQDALVVIKVSEYKNGLIVGTSEREMTFIVQDNCTGTPPVANISAVSGATLSGSNVLNICRGQPQVSFTIGIDNPDGDSTTLTPSNVPLSAALTISNNNTSAPQGHFTWATAGLLPGHYTFYVTIKNNHCPLFNIQTVAYTINVADPPTISAKQLSATHCIGKAGIEYSLAYGFIPRTITVRQGGVTVTTITDNSGADTSVIIDSLTGGTYTAIVSSDGLCIDSTIINVTDSGYLPVDDVNRSLCLGDPVFPVYVAPVAPGAVINWFELDGSLMTGAPIISTSSAAEYAWYFIETYHVCISQPVAVKAQVHPLPDGHILNVRQTVCYGDDIYLQAEGGVEYTWLPENAIKKDTDGLYVELITPTTLIVYIKDEFGCVDTEKVSYSDIQQCCHFSYPNAFTPNNDGHNDGFRVVTYGNMRSYDLTIYNRWGQRIFWTSDPHKVWDGTYGGVPCEIGTYYYYLNAQCLTGPKETHKGDVVLIR